MQLTDIICFFVIKTERKPSKTMITINSCGHDSHHPIPCNIEHREGLPDYLILLIKQEAWMVLEDRVCPVRPNSLILFPPNTYIHYGCDAAGYNDDWIHFMAAGEDLPFLQNLDLPLCRIIYPFDFHILSEYVRMMSDLYHSSSVHKEEMLDSFMHIFLYSLQEEAEKRTGSAIHQKYYPELSRLRTQIYNDPAAARTVPALAASACLSLSYFQHLYKQFFGISCRQDIIEARLKLARYYLTNSSMSVSGLAGFCGYDSDLHFMRQFKKFTGMTPTDYRRINT